MKKIVPLSQRMKAGRKNISAKEDAPKPSTTPSRQSLKPPAKPKPKKDTMTLEDIQAEMRADIQKELDSKIAPAAPKKKAPLKDNRGKLIQNQSIERRHDLESEKGNTEIQKMYKRIRTKKRLNEEVLLLPKEIREAHKLKPLYGHQIVTLDAYRRSPIVLDCSDPGTGKTRAALQAWAERRRRGGGKALILAPKTLLETAWEQDGKEFAADMRYSVAFASNREERLNADADAYITNIDAVNALAAMPKKFFKDFDTLIIDELTAFKHSSSGRSKSLRKICKNFTFRAGLTGTPNSLSVTDLHHQMLVLDDGERLGKSFYNFQIATCTPEQQGPQPNMVKWVDKPGAIDAVAGMLADVIVRHHFEDCMDIPENRIFTVKYTPPKKLITKYKEFEKQAVLLEEGGHVVGINAAAARIKLLQIASGAVYASDDLSGERPTVVLDTARSELVLQLIEERQWPSVVFFNWGHQKEQLMELASKRKINYAVLDRTTSDQQRTQIVKDYQAGLYKFILLHPKTGAHGLTLTRGRTTILVSPFPEADYFKQAMHRVYRGGQLHRTETLVVEAEGTAESKVYCNRDTKTKRMADFLGLVQIDEDYTDEL